MFEPPTLICQISLGLLKCLNYQLWCVTINLYPVTHCWEKSTRDSICVLRWFIVTCSSILAWRIACTEEPGGLQSVGSQDPTFSHVSVTVTCSVGHDWTTKLLLPLSWEVAGGPENLTMSKHQWYSCCVRQLLRVVSVRSHGRHFQAGPQWTRALILFFRCLSPRMPIHPDPCCCPFVHFPPPRWTHFHGQSL